MERKTFVIERSTWHRGQGADESALLIPATGKMCCLGSIALQAGATKDQISEQLSPAALQQKGTLPIAMLSLVGDGGRPESAYNSRVGGDMMRVNDVIKMTGADREARLTELASTIGWDLTFVD